MAIKDTDNHPSIMESKNKEGLSTSMSLRWKFAMGFLLSGMVFNGYIYGFPNAASYSLKTESGLNKEQISWISSISNLGVPIGSLLSGFIMNLMGRKLASLIFLGGSYMISRSLLIFAATLFESSETNMIFFFIASGRFIAGICQGFCNCLIILYAMEICRTQKQKIETGVISALFGYSATLISYVVGSFVNWKILTALQSLWSIPFIIGVILFVPESPVYFILKGQQDKALQSMTKLFGSDASYIYESYNYKKPGADMDKRAHKYLWTPSEIKNLFIGIGIMFFYQFAGYIVVNNNINDILASGNLISIDEFRPENIASIVISGAGLFGVLLGLYITTKYSIKGKWLLIGSGILSSMAFFVIGFVNYYKLYYKDYSAMYLYVGTTALVTHILFYSAGYGSFCLPIIAESQSPSVRPMAMSIIMTLGGGFAFLNAKSYYDLTEYLGGRLDFCFYIYGAINLLGTIFMKYFIRKDI
ncbi:trehalose transporter 1-like protein [Lepeophtheirus salmonis]|uniref:Trehalose transporter 12 [Drosophila melanogaster] n=1 Tax=Lepeophtheirus salmonis TaxID=72036 RepID=A0A0K2TJX0_LEPSM|nr:facilitated trehalose transporter Tret1-2 homolog [Lepeophtheirus salmonis]XP_040571546.1 facilitated trehalose transporter Tret1-2 homolog [Lepeophtheirus salmonis]XP_040571547.1 facilitated trehalose transporter Tret1-2 homolog [Lepeophtheirus salmonis]XP_040571549.1 facilitated trehalose transporter Tret1-2 homolog [Lepeophtheirus salmonis]XP_040571550.1 facilitated trehalose transporter Tret1-2 homolog [Lepeophtheirus salmonis]